MHLFRNYRLREIAVRGLKARGPRKDGGLSIRLGTAALSRQVAAGGPGDHLRDRRVAGLDINDPQGDTRSASAAGEGDKQFSLHLFVL